MKCIILCAGRGERMRPLTDTTPKPLLKIKGKPILDYIFESLPEEITEVILVVWYKKENIRRYIGTEYKGKKVSYVFGSPDGNVLSFRNTREYIKKDERFLLIYGDEMPTKENVNKCLSFPLSILTFGNTYLDGVMVLDDRIYDCTADDDDFKSMAYQFLKTYKPVLVEAKDFKGEINTVEKWRELNG